MKRNWMECFIVSYGRDVEPLAAIFFQFWHNFGISLRSSAGQMFSVYHTKLISWTAGPQLKNKLPRHHSKLLFRWSTSKNLISTIFDPHCFSFAIFLHSAAVWIKKVVWKEQFCSQFSVAGDKQVILEPLDFTSKTAANTSTLARVQLWTRN